MKIQELFTTLPGILIVSGVVLLVIAIVLFILGNKKAKKEAPSVENKIAEEVKEDIVTKEDDVKVSEPTIEPVTITEPEVEPVIEPVVETPAEPVTIPEPVVEESAAPISFDASGVVVEDQTAPVVEEEPEIKFDNNGVVTVDETAPVVEPVVETPAEPTPFTMPKLEPITVPSVEEQPAYGGVEPAETIPVVEEAAPTIYGGADPLEKTQTFPTVEGHQPYGGTPEVKIVDPTVEVPTIESSVIETPEPIKLEEPEEL